MMKNMIKRAATVMMAAAMIASTGLTAVPAMACDGGCYTTYNSCSNNYMVTGTENYLAIRTETAYDARNIIGKVYNNDIVQVIDKCTGNASYWYIYSPQTGKYGYVNCSYLTKADTVTYSYCSASTYTVSGTSNYLALRTAPEYDHYNIIDKLYDGDSVEVINKCTSDASYWYVRVPATDKYGYVNCKYLK